ncbi:hypothetical protein Tco_0702492 [Tanacetum coccineum]|uniref:Uncharacterized protein n=1 Tax=Tanacetum coccineum TaxID=301880 RepID=A0ABQ4XWZ2_9ASTR
MGILCLCWHLCFTPSASTSYSRESSGKLDLQFPPDVPETVTETVHSHEQVSTPLRPAPTNTNAQQNEQGPSSDPNFETPSTQAHDSIPDPVPSTNVEDESLGGTFFATPPKVHPAATHLSESDDEEAEEHDVDPLIKLAKAAASAADTSPIPANDNQTANIPPGASTHTTAFGSDTDVPTGPTFEFSADPFNKGKSPMVEEDPPIKQRSFRQFGRGTEWCKLQRN